MTRRVGQVGNWQALGGAAVAVAVVAGIVAGSHLLVPPGTAEPSLDAPATAGEPCPEAGTVISPVEVSASQLVDCPDAYDGVQVVYTGEAVRAVLLRQERAWLQVNDDPYALDLGPLPEHRTSVGGNSGIPVHAPVEAVGAISYLGEYRAQGDLLEVNGIFRRADPYDGGGPAIAADSVRVVRPGRRVVHTVSAARIAAAGLLTVIAIGLAALRRRRRASLG